MVGDYLDHMLVTGLIFGYGSGLVSRQSVRPLIGAASLLLAVVPTAGALALQALSGDLAHRLAYAAQALLVVAFTAGGLQTLVGAYRTTAGQNNRRHRRPGICISTAQVVISNTEQVLSNTVEDSLYRVAGNI